ncbi:MAG: hypothetical protein HC794_06135 [Nitrospiraceae bacterium]|nr:hypothetical protein [Nitrospiraceae bacterium]
MTKSLAGAVALLRLAAKYGDGILEEKITDHVRVTATHDGWKDVTFADALNMAVPIGEVGPHRDWPDPFADENQPKMLDWLIKARSAQEKLERGFSYGKYPWGRGEVVRYNTVVTFVLAAAMDAYLKRKEGPNAHLWDMVTEEVYRPIGIFHTPMMHTIEPDGSRGVPLLGFGLTPTIDDVAKLVGLLQARGQHNGVQILSAAKLDECPQPCGFHDGILQIHSGGRIKVERVRLLVEKPFSGRVEFLDRWDEVLQQRRHNLRRSGLLLDRERRVVKDERDHVDDRFGCVEGRLARHHARTCQHHRSRDARDDQLCCRTFRGQSDSGGRNDFLSNLCPDERLLCVGWSELLVCAVLQDGNGVDRPCYRHDNFG